jgi:heme-degrading monooxygenase HmoA
MRTLSMVHHRVADFDAWKQVYDSVVDVQRGGGVVFHQVLRDQSDPNMVVVTHSFETADEAHAFFDQQELKDAMQQAGVDMSSFQIWFLDEVETGNL